MKSGSDVYATHYHDFYHYYFGAKYYKEISHDKLYECTVLALRELEYDQVLVPEIQVITALDNQGVRYVQHGDAGIMSTCKNNFTDDRWKQFYGDIVTYLASNDDETIWQEMLLDLGNNSPPSWNILPSIVANIIPFNIHTLKYAPLFDIFIFLIVVPVIVYRGYGMKVLMLYMCIYLSNPLAVWSWNGGSYFRSLWYLTLIAGISALSKKKYAMSSILLMTSSLFRVFPMMFFIGALIYLYRKKGDSRASVTEFITYGIMTAIVVISISVMQFGCVHWHDFFRYVGGRIDPLNSNAIGLYKIAYFYTSNFPDLNISKQMFETWISSHESGYLAIRLYYFMIVLFIVSGAVYFLRAAEDPEVSVLFGVASIFCIFTAFTYYYLFLSLLSITALRSSRWLGKVLLLLLSIFALRYFSVPFQYELGNNPEFYEVSYYSSYIILIFLLVYYLLLAKRNSSVINIFNEVLSQLRLNPEISTSNIGKIIYSPLTISVLIIFIIFTFSKDSFERINYKEINEFNLALSESVRAYVQPASNEWVNADYVVFELLGKDTTVDIELNSQGKRQVDLEMYVVEGSEYDDFVINISGNKFTIDIINDGYIRNRILVFRNIYHEDRSVIRIENIDGNSNARIGIDGLVMN